MNALVHARQQAQLAFVASGANLVVGEASACPLSPEALAALTPADPRVVEQYGGGLTARVLHLCIDDVHYTLKQRRPEALVRNIDGQTSFLNEVQRRADFTRLKADPAWADRLASIVPTLYADYRLGIILSPWIPGSPLARVTPALLAPLLETLTACEEAGLMEWDLCPGNLLDDGERLWLFDFGYMYPFDPLSQFNSNGLADPLFHACERFETRFFFGWLLQQPLDEQAQLACYRQLKQLALAHYASKRQRLATRGATTAVLAWLDEIMARWQRALGSEAALRECFELEAFRSHVLDIEDDLHGQSCTATTLKRIDVVCQALTHRYGALAAGGALFYDNAGRDQASLLALYAHKRQQAQACLLPGH